jgi:hypothetical protein
MTIANLTTLVAGLRSRGAEIWLDGDQACVRAPANVYTADVRAELVSSKADLFALLHAEVLESSAPSAEPRDVRPAAAQGATCRRCGGAAFQNTAIHDGASVRRDCAVCGSFVDFSIWYGVDQTGTTA